MENWEGGFLYRYRKWDEYTKKILLDGEFYYASLHSLNDPNEGKNISAVLIRDALEKEFLPTAISTDEKKFIKHQIEMFDKNPQVVKGYKKAIKDHIKEMGIVCCTTRHNNNPMWHFYADENKGVCIEFYFPELYSQRYDYLCPCPVNYNPIIHTSKKAAEILIFNKDSDWSYEREFRLLSRNLKDDASRIRTFPVERMLCSVIAGHNMDNDSFNALKKLIRQVNKKYNTKVTVHRRLSREYGIISLESEDRWEKRHRSLKFIGSKIL